MKPLLRLCLIILSAAAALGRDTAPPDLGRPEDLSVDEVGNVLEGTWDLRDRRQFRGTLRHVGRTDITLRIRPAHSPAPPDARPVSGAAR